MRVKIFANDDIFFTRPLVFTILNSFPKNTSFYVQYETLSLNRKLKSLVVLFLFTPLFKFAKFFFKKKNYFNKNYDYDYKDYDLGIIINYPKLLKLQKFPLYNFHLGNIENQRGSFIYLYKFLYEWKKINLSFYRLTEERFDVGVLINSKSFNCSNKSALDILLLYETNPYFIKSSINLIFKKKFYNFKNKKKRHKKLNVAPSWYLIFKIFFISKIVRVKSYLML
jgi:hypothetical protein